MSEVLASRIEFAAREVPSQQMVQLIDPQGRVTETGVAHHIDVELAEQLHRDMVLARCFDREALALQRQGSLNLWLMSWGQEAAQVGSIRALRSTDMVFPSYREHAAALCRGITPGQLMRQWKGLSHSGWDSTQSRFHFYTLVLGTQTLHATGYAAGARLERSDEVVATYVGDGASSQGDVNEAFNWAAASSLPVLFICQNNQWAISTPAARQMRTPLHVRAAGFGLDAYHVDGNDVMAVHAVTARAVERIRQGGGPALIEAQTYRLGGHSSSDDPKRYRSAAEFEAWQTRDPVIRSEAFLRGAGVSSDYFDDLARESEAFAAQVRQECRQLETDALVNWFDNVYAEPHRQLAHERESHIEHLASIESTL